MHGVKRIGEQGTCAVTTKCGLLVVLLGSLLVDALQAAPQSQPCFSVKGRITNLAQNGPDTAIALGTHMSRLAVVPVVAEVFYDSSGIAVDTENVFDMDIPTDDPLTPEIEGAAAGEPLFFMCHADYSPYNAEYGWLFPVQTEGVVHLPGEHKEIFFEGDIAISVDEEDERSAPSGFMLSQNYPNPFNPTTEISFSLSHAGQATLEIYNIMGQKVATLVDERLEAGEHTYQWDASDNASGVYFYRLAAEGKVETRKMLRLK